MLDCEADIIMTTEMVDKRGHRGPQRRCIATGVTQDKADMVRFVLGPDGAIVPDIAAKLPGRGVWVSASRDAVVKAVKNGAFSRGFKTKLDAPQVLADQVEQLLARRILSLLTMAHKSGAALMGFEQVRTAAQSEPLAWRIEASDGAAAGRGKIRVLTKAVSHELGQAPTPVIGCFTAEQLGQAMGRDSVTHAALRPGGLAKALSQAALRYSGFARLYPADWADRDHEDKKTRSAKHDRG